MADTPLLREFDLQYWQMREALGYPIPDRIDRRWRQKFAGNGGANPFRCGPCEGRRLYPDAHRVGELTAARASALEDAATYVRFSAGSSDAPESWDGLANAIRNLPSSP